MSQSPMVRWGVPVVVLSALVILFFIVDPLGLRDPSNTEGVDAEAPIAALEPELDEGAAAGTRADLHRVAASESAPNDADRRNELIELNELDGMGGVDLPSGAAADHLGSPTDSAASGMAAEQDTQSEPESPLADVAAAGAPALVGSDAASASPDRIARDAAAAGSGAIADGISANRPGLSPSQGAGSGALARGSATPVDGGLPHVGAPDPGEAAPSGRSADAQKAVSGSTVMIPALGGHARHRFPAGDVAAVASRLGPGIRNLASAFDDMQPCDVLGADCVGSLGADQGRRIVTPPWTPWQPARLP